MDKTTIRIVSGSAGKSPLEVPTPTLTHYFTAGKLLSFNEPNENGFVFEADKVPDEMVTSLVASTTDLQHVKAGYGFTDKLFPGQDNTTVGAILSAKKTDDGIYIVNKIERAVAKAFGYAPEDFGPGMIFGKLSQECDFSIPASEWVSMKDGKIVSRVSYADGVAAGYPIAANNQWAGSHVENGTWKYHKDGDGNPVFMSVKLISFAGAGHVVNPADPSATITRLAASAARMVNFIPGMDVGPDAPSAMTFADEAKTSDGNYFMSDFMTHPDLLNAEVDKHAYEDDDQDDDVPDDHFAACFMRSDYDNVQDGKPAQSKVRAFRIKNDKGELDRKRLIAAYRAIHGLRGNIEKADRLPFHVRASALALVRHGLKETNKNLQGVNKKVSMLVSGVTLTDAQEAEAIANIEKQLLAAQKVITKGDHDAVVAERDDLKTQITTLTASLTEAKTAITTLQGEKDTLTAKIADGEAEKLAASRYAELNEILPFSDADKADAEKHGEFVKGLAKMSADGFDNAKLTRTVAKLTAQVNSSAPGHITAGAVGGGAPVTNPIPVLNMNGATGENAPGVAVIY